MRRLTLSVDFDGLITIGSRNFPECGRLRPEAKETINKWHRQGHYIIINTCRNPVTVLQCAEFLALNEIHFDTINENNPDVVAYWGTDTRKISADLYFDDRSGVVNWGDFDDLVYRFSKPTVICIIGESGTGKTTVADFIRDNYTIPSIESRTTRAKRSEDESGHTFVSDEEFDSYKQEDMIAFTEFGGKRYCCLKKDVSIRNTYVIDEAGYLYLCEHFGGEFNIFSIRIRRYIEERIKMVGQERVARDENKFNLGDYAFDEVIINNFGKQQLYDKIDKIMTNHMLYI